MSTTGPMPSQFGYMHGIFVRSVAAAPATVPGRGCLLTPDAASHGPRTLRPCPPAQQMEAEGETIYVPTPKFWLT